MKEIFSAIAVVVGLWGGTKALTEFYDTVRKAALEKAAQGLPPMATFSKNLTKTRSTENGSKGKK